MIKKMNNLSDKIVEYRNEVMNSLLTFDLLQAHLKPAHIQNCCFEDFEYVYRQALSIEEVRMVIGIRDLGSIISEIDFDKCVFRSAKNQNLF